MLIGHLKEIIVYIVKTHEGVGTVILLKDHLRLKHIDQNVYVD